MIYGVQDVIKLRQMSESSQGSEEFKRQERYRLDAMLGLCEITSCRRRTLLEYFGEPSQHDCGTCDSCLNPVPLWDGTEAARKALSCVFRTGQKFGVNHLVDVLRGSENQKIIQFNHNQVSTYGIGRELDVNQWRSVFRQLVARGYLTVDVDGFGGLQLSEICRPLLQGEEKIDLRKEDKTTGVQGKAKKKAMQTGNEKLWELLRAERKRLAELQDVPPYMIFHDATLMEMVRLMPTSLTALERINGVGASKLEHYGQAFVDLLLDYQQSAEADGGANSDTIEETYVLIKQHGTAARVAELRQLNQSTVVKHLEELLRSGRLDLSSVLDVEPSEILPIEEALLAAQAEGDQVRMKPIFELFDGAVDYDTIRCVQAALLFKIESPSSPASKDSV
jgi:ATP-dependent DNA helicase RecQ